MGVGKFSFSPSPYGGVGGLDDGDLHRCDTFDDSKHGSKAGRITTPNPDPVTVGTFERSWLGSEDRGCRRIGPDPPGSHTWGLKGAMGFC